MEFEDKLKTIVKKEETLSNNVSKRPRHDSNIDMLSSTSDSDSDDFVVPSSQSRVNAIMNKAKSTSSKGY